MFPTTLLPNLSNVLTVRNGIIKELMKEFVKTLALQNVFLKFRNLFKF